MKDIDRIKEKVYALLQGEETGHDQEHIERVLNLALKFAEKENANKELVAYIALLHDVDDYKLVGIQNAELLTNTQKILNECSITQDIKEIVRKEVSSTGYSKRLDGIMPSTLEGKIVSDADMCDAMGANGILRCYQYNLAHHRNFFDKNVFPKEYVNAMEYKQNTNGTVVTHIFEKLLKLKDLMFTKAGREEATARHNFMFLFLKEYFREEEARDWEEFLDNFRRH